MSFDINTTTKQMLSALSGVLADEWGEIQECMVQALSIERQVLEDIALARVRGEIDDEELRQQLEDETIVVEAALLACRVKAKQTAQQASNAAMDVLKGAIQAAL